MSIDDEEFPNAKPEEMLSDKDRERLGDAQETQPAQSTEEIERNRQIEILKSRVSKIILDAAERQNILRERLQNYYDKKAVAQMDGSEEGQLAGMVSMGMDASRDIEDMSIEGLDSVPAYFGMYFASNNLIGISEFQSEVDAMETDINDRLIASENFVRAIESGENSLQARFNLKKIDAFGDTWQKFLNNTDESVPEEVVEPVSTDDDGYAARVLREGKEKIQLNYEIEKQLAGNSGTVEREVTGEGLIARLEKAKAETMVEVNRTGLRAATLHDLLLKQLEGDRSDPKLISEQRQRIERNLFHYSAIISNIKEDLESFVDHVRKRLESVGSQQTIDSKQADEGVLRLKTIASPLYGLNEQLDILENSYKQT